MTPHSVVESMVDAVKDHGGHERLRENVDLAVWPDVLRALRTAVHFEFDSSTDPPTVTIIDIGDTH